MLVFGSKRETLPHKIETDATTGLPLLCEKDAIMQIILAYLALPYSVVGYGCGKKVSLIIEQLLKLNIPAYAITRGMIMEYDMSPAAMNETRPQNRKHALVADNPLYRLGKTSDPNLRDMLNKTCQSVTLLDDGCIQAGPYTLRPDSQVQYSIARSHIFTIITFWDDENACCTEQVLDPGLLHDDLFKVEQTRHYLDASEGWIFQAPLLAHFRLVKDHLTCQQQQAVSQHISIDDLENLTLEQHSDLVRKVTGAEQNSLGDPHTWSYANNMTPAHDHAQLQDADKDQKHYQQQLYYTGRGDGLVKARQQLFEARKNRTGSASEILTRLRQITDESNLHQIVQKDARWSIDKLEPLADAATLFVYYQSLKNLADKLRKETLDSLGLLNHLENNQDLQELRGFGVRLRRRIDWLGSVSQEEDGRIDARALKPGFIKATIETIRQMNVAGLTVWIDKVGNIHGFLLDQAQRQAIQEGTLDIAHLAPHSIGHGSHIDTVNDAGKFDGRLGVLSGLDTLHIIHDLQHYFDLPFSKHSKQTATQAPVTQPSATKNPPPLSTCAYVSAFIGEEMTYTGENVSMPGSAAIAGQSKVEQVHKMRNGEGEIWREQLQTMLQHIQQAQQQGKIKLSNDLTQCDTQNLIAHCSDPQDFYSPHTYERHIEQGPLLDRAQIPIVIVGTIMGIHQEDFTFKGKRAEAAALDMNRQLRQLTAQKEFSDVRITVGMIHGSGNNESIENVHPALHWTLEGEMNHAGATPTPDRRDPGVAAARLARRFLDWFEEKSNAKYFNPQDKISPVISNVQVTPGTNRNVIPATASFTTALTSDKKSVRSLVDELTREDLTQTLEGYVISTLARQVAGGGEGIQLCRVEPVSYTTLFSEAVLSIDLRSDQDETTTQFRQQIDEIVKNIEHSYQVDISSQLQQKLSPSNLEQSGQALLMERSYGGSHNPRETELLSDIVRGSVLQLAITQEILNRDDLQDFNLFEQVEQKIPKAWRNTMARFTSGALHDTCNIAAAAKSQQQLNK